MHHLQATAFLVLLAALLVLGQIPPRPTLSEVFHSPVKVQILRDNVTTHTGEGLWISDQPNGKLLEKTHFNENPEMNVLTLFRYDLERSYEVSMAHHECHSFKLEGTMPSNWGWLADARFQGTQTLHGKQYDLWELERGYAKVGVYVDPNNSNVPVFFARKTPDREVAIEFLNFKTQVNANDFDIPTECNGTAIDSPSGSVGCMARKTAIARAQNWVSNHVPYNQGGHYGGYREDCSGYVSMAWELAKPGLVTSTLPHVSHRISKGDLQAGDVLLNVAEHVVLFGGWADSSHSHYVAYEETRPGEGTVKRVTPYPYWYQTSSFVPYRYNSMC